MKIHELVESQQINLARRAFESLSSEAQSAIHDWEMANWIGGSLERHIKANDEIAQEIERAFAPIRATMPKTLHLYRGLRPNETKKDWQNKYLESWTSDPRVAKCFAGLYTKHGSKYRSRLRKVPTDEEIAEALHKYETKGFVKFLGHFYLRSQKNPEFYQLYDLNREHITSGKSSWLKKQFKDTQIERQQHNDNLLRKSCLIEQDIPRENIVWLTNNIGSKEYIVRLKN